MEILKYNKADIAASMLDTAIVLYFSGGDGFSIVQLAAASEEVLAGLLAGKFASGAEVLSARKKSLSVLERIHELRGSIRTGKKIGTNLNFVRNQTKHHSHGDDQAEIFACLDLEVKSVLCRAIDNYIQLFGMPTENITSYINGITIKNSTVAEV